MNRREFVTAVAAMLSLLGIRKEADKSKIRDIRSLKDEWSVSAWRMHDWPPGWSRGKSRQKGLLMVDEKGIS